ncbi:MAG TPA: site-specific integrase [Terriglobales bacterium]|jgi:integrase|nr:site-specific integrase [Terriglobales bacterium]
MEVLYQDKRDKCWRFYWWENGKRHATTLGRFPSKTKAWAAAKPYRDAVEATALSKPSAITVGELVKQYRVEKMPQRASTRRGYESFIRNYILPEWQDSQITELQARPVELWIQSLARAPKTKVHIRGLIQTLWDYAMWCGDVATQRNPMELVQIRNASKRVRKPRTMTIEEFHRLSAVLTEPYRTMATVAVCLGLRWSELVGLKWQDINWINGELRLQRAVVKQVEDEVKTVHSSKPLALDPRILDLLKQHRQNSIFTEPEDWIFASPEKHGKLPRGYTSFWEKLGRACQDAGLVHVSPHSFRHSYRAWLDEVGTPITVQQRAMRHGDIRVTMNYGDAIGDGLREASAKVAARAIPQ